MNNMVISIWFVIAMVWFLPIESYLMYVNYLARVKYKRYFKETTKFWLEFDKRGLTVPSLILHFAIMTTGIVILASFTELQFFAGLGVGLIFFNAIIDDRRLKNKLPCIETKCSNLDAQQKCLNCALSDEYDISVLPHIKIRKKKTTEKS